MIGTTLSHFKITAKLGEGGMGEVYRAEDLKLGREVALKVLPAELAASQEKLERFQREAQALAALDHPGIVTVYSVEEADGVHFLTMQLVDGEPLDRLIPAGGLGVDRILEIGTAVAEALAAAHEKGIVHRDLKPANIMVTGDGRVKVLDFGLAKMAAPSAGQPLDTQMPTALQTREGIVMGTVPYMSPEQVAGRGLDPRTDIFSLGVVLYEMAAGRRPFAGQSSAELASAILRDRPESPAELRTDLPPGLARVIDRCLEKDPAARFATARELCAGLDKWTGAPSPDQTGVDPAARTAAVVDSGATRAEESFWVAVLPFRGRGAHPDLEALAEGLSEDIVTGLSRFSYLRVIAHESSRRYSSESLDVLSVGKEIGARYVLQGSLRQAGSALRIAVQLIDANTGAHQWAETYNRRLREEDPFALQDELVPRIVSTVADWYGALPHSMSEAVRFKPPDQLSAYEAVLRSFGYFERISPEEHAVVRAALESAVEQEPGNGDGWAMLSMMYGEEHRFGFNVQPDALERSLQAARRAVDAAHANHFAWLALAQAHFFRKELDAFRNAAERAIALNSMDGSTLQYLSHLIAFSGDWQRGCELAEQARQLNPNHPGWYWVVHSLDAYRQGDYEGARRYLAKCLTRGGGAQLFTQALLAAVEGQLGGAPAAAETLRNILSLDPGLAVTVRREFDKWYLPDLVEQLMEGLHKAGLEDPTAPAAESSSTAPDTPDSTRSGAARVDEGFWIAVLPFRFTGADADLASLTEGLTEEILTGLSRYSYLRVISRSSTQRYAEAAVDVRTVGTEIGARYVMEGSLRQVGTRLRLAVQLVDATTGAHLWAENYQRAFSPDTVFDLQDELVPRIVSTIADMNGVLPRSMGQAVRSRSPEDLSPYEAVLRSFVYFERATAEELAAAHSALELAVQKAPEYPDAWALLAHLCAQDYGQGFRVLTDPLARGAAAANRAVETGPSIHLGFFSLAQVLFFQRQTQAFRNAAERAATLNPTDGNSIAFMGELLTYSGEFERGLELAGRAKQLNPNHPGWYWYADFYNSYRQGDYRDALGFALKVNMPGHWFMHAALAATYGQLGEKEAAAKSVQDLLAVRPDFAKTARGDSEKWWGPDYVEKIIDGWRKAGLSVPDATAAVSEATAPAAESAAEVPPSEKSGEATVAIAVLPFSDMSPAKDQEYFCEGMAEEVMNALVGIAGLRVASRTSTFRASREGQDLAAIGRLLGVDQVLEGSVRIAGGRLRVTARLSDVDTGYQLWSERYDRPAEDVFAIQDEIAAHVVEAVEARLAPGARAVAARPQVRNLEAYRCYLKGRHLRGKEDHEGAHRAFEEALRLDPSHAPSWTALAEITALAVHFSLIPAHEGLPAAREALATAAELQGESADGLHVEAFVAFIERRWADMEATWRRALELQPDHILSLGALGLTLCTRQRLDDGLPLLERARETDPLASFPYARTAVGLLTCGRPEEALRHAQDGLTFGKDDVTAVLASSMAKVALGRLEEGIAEAEQTVTLSQRGAFFLGVLGWALATGGRKDDARAVLEEMRVRPPAAPTIVSEAWLLGALGELDEAFEVLRRAEEEYQAMLYYTGFPAFDPLRADPRFQALLERLELPTETPGR